MQIALEVIRARVGLEKPMLTLGNMPKTFSAGRFDFVQVHSTNPRLFLKYEAEGFHEWKLTIFASVVGAKTVHEAHINCVAVGFKSTRATVEIKEPIDIDNLRKVINEQIKRIDESR